MSHCNVFFFQEVDPHCDHLSPHTEDDDTEIRFFLLTHLERYLYQLSKILRPSSNVISLAYKAASQVVEIQLRQMK